MRSRLLAVAAVLLASSPALAADLTVGVGDERRGALVERM